MFRVSRAVKYCLANLFAGLLVTFASHTSVYAQRPEPKPNLSVLAGISGGISYSGLNTYITLGAAYKRHIFYVGPRAVLSKSFIPGRTLWGLNGGYSVSVVDEERWNTWVNLDYQHTTFRVPAQVKYNTIHEITGGLNLNYFVVPQKLAIGLTLGAGVYLERYYNKYTAAKEGHSGLMQQIRLGLVYKISRQ